MIFQLKEKIEGKETSVQFIIANVFSDNKRLKFGVGITIKPEDFGKKVIDPNTNKLKDHYNYNRDFINKSRKPIAIELRTRIAIIESCFTEARSSFERKNIIPTSNDFRIVFDKLRVEKGILSPTKIKIPGEVKTINKNIVSEFIKFYIEDCEFQLENNTPIVKADTIKKYKSIYHHWLNYEEYKKKSYIFSELTEDIVVEFLHVCTKIKTGKIKLKSNHIKNKRSTRDPEGYSKQSIDNIIDIFTGLVNKAASEGIKNNINLKSQKLQIKKIGRKKEYFINEDTLVKLIESKPKSKLLQQARDYVVLASTTGMRYQSVCELNGLKIEYIEVDGTKVPVIRNIANKTDNETYSTLFRPALDIYKSNGNRFPKIYSLSYLNMGIRKLFKELKIKDTIKVYNTTFGSKPSHSQELACDHVSSHDCRSTFISNMLLHEVQRDVVKSMTHQHDRGDAFSLYDKTSVYDKAKAFYRATKNLKSEVFNY